MIINDMIDYFGTEKILMQTSVWLLMIIELIEGTHLLIGKDLIDHLFACADSGMVKIDLDTDDRLAADDNRLTAVEGRVDVVRRDLIQSSDRLDVVVARASEEGDASINEK